MIDRWIGKLIHRSWERKLDNHMEMDGKKDRYIDRKREKEDNIKIR